MKLNLGCGNNYREGFVNLDDGNCRADVYHDLNVVPYPFEDNQFSYILAQQVLEHVNRSKWFDIVRELHRISKPNAIWEVMTPYALSDNFFTDPTHSMPFTLRTFDFFDKTKALSELGTIYGIDFELQVLEAQLVENPPNGPDVHFRIMVLKDNGVPQDKAMRYAHKIMLEQSEVMGFFITNRNQFGRTALIVGFGNPGHASAYWHYHFLRQDLRMERIDILEVDPRVVVLLRIRKMLPERLRRVFRFDQMRLLQSVHRRLCLSEPGFTTKTDIYHGDIRTWQFPRKYDLIYWSHGPEHIYASEWSKTFSRIIENANRCFFTRFPWGSFYDNSPGHLTKSIDVPMVQGVGLDLEVFTSEIKDLDGGEIFVYKFKG